MLSAERGTVLLCHFHANAPREGINGTPPFFSGLGVTNGITASLFIPSDPVLVLDPNLTLAWHFGCDGVPLQAITVCIVKKLQTILQAPRVVAWGGSGGGFAAIRVAKDIASSIALVWNPQTDITKYLPDAVNRYLRIAFPTIALNGTVPSGTEQFPSLCTEDFHDGYQGCILYLQERTDGHTKAHLTPFLASFCGKSLSDIAGASNFSGLVTDHLYLHLDHWGDGHVPPSKEVIAKLLGLLSDVTTDGDNHENVTCIPGEAIEYISSTISTYVPATEVCGKNDSGQFGGSSTADSPLDYKEILAVRMDGVGEDFLPFDETVSCSGDTVAIPLFTGEVVEVSLSDGIQWNRTFATQARSCVMWLFSLAWIGRLLSTFQKRNEVGALQFALVALKSFIDYSSDPDHLSKMGRLLSGDHSAATRVRVLIKCIQVMRERQDVDHDLLIGVCDSLKYWSDWLVKSKNYQEENRSNHGVMGSFSLLHSAVQFGAAPHASVYLNVATTRLIEHGKSSFDRDGLCNENTIGYHNYNVNLYRQVFRFCKQYGFSETLVNFLQDLIQRGTQVLECCVWQDGSIPPLGDSGVYRTKIASQDKSRCFYESGFAVVKNDVLYLSIICGARMEYHKQVDDSSLTLRFRNRDILIDGGSYSYDRTDPYRRCVESSFGHSGLFLKDFDGLLRTEFLKKFGPVSGKIEQFEESDEGVRIKCLYSVRDGRAVFVRHIFVCWPDEVAIVDSVEVSDIAIGLETVQRFLFGPTLDVRFDGRDKLILAAGEFSCTLFQLVDCEGILYYGEKTSPVRGWYSEKWNEILPTNGVDFIRNSQTNRFSTILKLSKCASLSECSTTVRAFAGLVDISK